MSAVVVDASALLALLRGEVGTKKVEGALAEARMSVVNMAEVALHYSKLEMPGDVVSAMLTPLPITLVEADVEHCWEAGRLRGLTVEAGLSLVDRFCLALAKREELPAWTFDRKGREIADAVGVTVLAIR